jgi:hypothetical protein
MAHAWPCFSYEGLDMSADQFPKNPPTDVGFSILGMADWA